MRPTPAAAAPTVATVNKHGQTIVTHPDAEGLHVAISANGDTFHAYAEANGVAMSAFCGKSYKTAAGARRAADKWLTERAARLAADRAHQAAHPYTAPLPAADPMQDEIDELTADGYVAEVQCDASGRTVAVTRGARVL